MAHMGKICCKVGVVSQGWYGGYGAPLTRCLETSGMAVPFWLTDSSDWRDGLERSADRSDDWEHGHTQENVKACG